MKKVYKVLSKTEWHKAINEGIFKGAAIDLQDGYIHLSTAEQVEETVEKHFKGQSNLLLISFDTEKLGDALKWEQSRNDDLFPHLYANLQPTLADQVLALVDRQDGGHDFPETY